MQLCVIMELPFRAALRKLVLYKADPLFPFKGGRKHLFEHPSCTFKQRSNCSLHQLLHLCAAPLSEGAAVCTKQLLPLFVLAGILTQVIKALTGVSNSSRLRVPLYGTPRMWGIPNVLMSCGRRNSCAPRRTPTRSHSKATIP